MFLVCSHESVEAASSPVGRRRRYSDSERQIVTASLAHVFEKRQNLALTSPRRRWNTMPEVEAELKAKRDKLVQQTVDGELRWLAGAGAEPGWPTPPRREPRARASFRLPTPPTAAEKIVMLEDALPAKDGDGPTVPLDHFDDEDEIDPPWFSPQSAALWLKQLSGTPVDGCKRGL